MKEFVAKEPGRTVFCEMLARIEKGEAQGFFGLVSGSIG